MIMINDQYHDHDSHHEFPARMFTSAGTLGCPQAVKNNRLACGTSGLAIPGLWHPGYGPTVYWFTGPWEHPVRLI